MELPMATEVKHLQCSAEKLYKRLKNESKELSANYVANNQKIPIGQRIICNIDPKPVIPFDTIPQTEHQQIEIINEIQAKMNFFAHRNNILKDAVAEQEKIIDDIRVAIADIEMPSSVLSDACTDQKVAPQSQSICLE